MVKAMSKKDAQALRDVTVRNMLDEKQNGVRFGQSLLLAICDTTADRPDAFLDVPLHLMDSKDAGFMRVYGDKR